VYLYVAESAWDDISNNDELFIAYGKHNWLYRLFWDSLSAADKDEATSIVALVLRRNQLILCFKLFSVNYDT
jgi:hypothetical protein